MWTVKMQKVISLGPALHEAPFSSRDSWAWGATWPKKPKAVRLDKRARSLAGMTLLRVGGVQAKSGVPAELRKLRKHGVFAWLKYGHGHGSITHQRFSQSAALEILTEAPLAVHGDVHQISGAPQMQLPAVQQKQLLGHGPVGQHLLAWVGVLGGCRAPGASSRWDNLPSFWRLRGPETSLWGWGVHHLGVERFI